jgi:hypothetical protein
MNLSSNTVCTLTSRAKIIKTCNIATYITKPCYIIFLHPVDDADEVMAFPFSSYTYCITSSCLPFAMLLPAASELAVGTCCLLFIASVSRARLYCRHGIALRGTSCFYRKKNISVSQIHCHIIQTQCSKDPSSSKIIYILMFPLYSLLDMHYYLIKMFFEGA